ncbi:MAG: hypothetical protein RSF88_10145 [Lachnospiraceae bacterium]
MKKSVNKVMKYSMMISLIITAYWLLMWGRASDAVISFLQNVQKNASQQMTGTSTEYRYEQEFQKTIRKYNQFGTTYQEKNSTAIPGLIATDVLGNVCEQMVPQGICIAGDYMIVSAYDNIAAYAGEKKQKNYEVNNSVLYILSNQDPSNRKLLTTMVLPDINHVGGVAFDGARVWIAKSTTKQCSTIDYNEIKTAANSGADSYWLSEYTDNVKCGAVASFLTYYNDKLWVGTYSNLISGMGTLRSYDITNEESLQLVKQEEIQIPGYANGVAFMENGTDTYMAVSTSKGRYYDSNIYFYQVEKDMISGNSIYYCYNSCKFPPMAEELICDGENTYFLFESSATCYSTQTYQKCAYPVDRICALSTEHLFRSKAQPVYQADIENLKSISGILGNPVLYREEKYYWLNCA